MSVVKFLTRADAANKTERKSSETLSPDFVAVSVGGASPITISKVSSQFDFGAIGLRNLGLDATPTNYTPADASQLDDHLAAIDVALGTASTDVSVKVSATDTTTGFLGGKLVVSQGSNTTNILETSILNPAGDEDFQIQIDESKINHNALLNFASDGHVLHAGVSVIAASDSGLSAVNNNLSSNIGLALDIDGLTAITAVANADTIAIDDGDAGVNRKITRANFIQSLSIDMGANTVSSSTAPTTANELANKAYVDSLTNGLSWKNPARVETAVNTSLAAPGANVDAVAMAVDDRVLLTNQTAPAENGIWLWKGAAVPMVRPEDFNGAGEADSASVMIAEGTSANEGYVQTADSVTIDTTAQTWVQFFGGASLSAGDGIDIISNVISTDLLASGGLKIVSTELAVEPADFAGTGLEDDGADNLRLAAQGNGIDGGAGSVLSVKANITEVSTTEASAILVAAGGVSIAVDNATLEGSGQGAAGAESLRVKDGGIDADALAASVAGDGLAGGAGSALSVNTGDGIKIDTDAVVRDDAITAQNDDAGAVTIRQVVRFEADGNYVKADKSDAAQNDGTRYALVEDASIASAASGKVKVRSGALVSGFAGLTPSAPVYLGAAGALIQTTAAFVAGTDSVVRIGFAHSATVIEFNPKYETLF